MIPIGDDNPTVRTPVATLLLVGLTALAWVVIQGAGLDGRVMAASVCNLGLVPAELTGMRPVGFAIPLTNELLCVVDAEPVNWATPVLSLFLHGGWLHLLGNLLFLWVYGNNVEDVMGRGRFVLFYLVCGLAAAVAHVAVSPASPVPTVGASGAISGVMGAYLVLFPRVRVRMLFWFVIILKVFRIPAWVTLGWWFVLQVWEGLPELAGGMADLRGGVAVWAHAGGFVAGALLVKFFEDPRLVARRRNFLLANGLDPATAG